MDEQKIGYKVILRQKEFMKTVLADIINRFGDCVDGVALVWLIYQVTQSAAWSAILFGVNRLPTIFLQPFAGAAIEGKNKKMIMVVTDVIRGICVGFIAIALVCGFLNKWIILIATLVISCAEAFRGPASTAILPKLLDKKYYEFGLSLSRSTSSITELIGIGLAGVIIATFSVSTAIFIDMITFFLSALILFTLKVKEENLSKGKINAKEYVDSLKDGFAYIKENAILRYFVVLAVFLNGILVPYNSLQAPLISEVLHSTEIMLSVMACALTIGMILGAGVYPYLSRKLNSRIVASLGGYSIGLFYFSMIVVGRFITSAILMYILMALISFIVGVAVSLLSSFLGVELVKSIEEQYLARISSIYGAACVAAMPVVSFLISAIAGFTPTWLIFVISGVLDIIICINLCSKKKFLALKKDVKEEDINEETIGDSQAC